MARVPKAPVSSIPTIPEVGVDTTDIRKAAKKLGTVFYKRVLGHIHNEMIVSADKTLEQAKADAGKYFDSHRSDKGLMAQGLFHWAKPVVHHGGKVTMGFGWTRRYGRVLEFGPSVSEWMIYPKFRKALRWMSSDFMGPTRSGVPGQKVMFAKQVKHKDSPRQRRPHLVPAVEKGIPRLEKRIAKAIEREFLRTRL